MPEHNEEQRLMRRMKRIELMEMIHALRKSNLELEEECKSLREQLSTLSAMCAGNERLDRMEKLLQMLCVKLALEPSDAEAEEGAHE